MSYSQLMQYKLPLNNLNTFAAAAEHLSFQEAAESLYVTPSAVSHQVRKLENLLGYKLFERLDKGVKLTLQGQKLFADIQAPMKKLHEATRKALGGVEDNSLALSVAPVFATGWLLPRLKDFYTRYPNINLSVIATTDLVDFNSDPFDASIRMGQGNWDNTTSLRLFNKEIVAVCHPSLIKQNKGLFTSTQCIEHSLIQNSSMPLLWNEWCQSANIPPPNKQHVSFQAQNSAQVIEALQSGNAIGLLDRSFIHQDFESGRLIIACDHILKSEDGYFLTAPESVVIRPSLRCFKEWLCMQLNIDLKL